MEQLSKVNFQTKLDFGAFVSPDERRIPMKTLKRVLASAVVTLAIIALAGCGVSKEDHEKVVSELNKTKAELEKTVAELSKSKSDLAQTSSKVADVQKSLSEALAQLKGEAKEPAAVEKPAGAETGTQEKPGATQ